MRASTVSHFGQPFLFKLTQVNAALAPLAHHCPMVTTLIWQNVRNRATDLSGMEREKPDGSGVLRSGHVIVAACLASALTALVALAGLIALV